MVLVKKTVSYVGKDKKEHQSANYYVVHNKKFVSIKPSFVSDYSKLNFLSIDYDDYLKQIAPYEDKE